MHFFPISLNKINNGTAQRQVKRARCVANENNFFGQPCWYLSLELELPDVFFEIHQIFDVDQTLKFVVALSKMDDKVMEVREGRLVATNGADSGGLL